MAKRKKRKGEYTCRCAAYSFPHRFSGGRCTLLKWVRRFWHREPHSPLCQECACYVYGECQVADGIEAVTECEALVDFIAYEEIKPTRWKKR